jgi:integrase
VEAFRPPQDGTAFLWDTEVPGFALRVHRTARGEVWRAYVVRFQVNGKDRWITIGKHGAPWRPDTKTGAPRTLTAELAREEALRCRGTWQAGGDPRVVRGQGRAAGEAPARAACPTLEDFSKRYLDQHSDLHKAYRSAKEDRGLLKRHILPWRGKARLDDVGPGDVAELQASLRETPVTANRAVALVSHMFTMARRWRVVPKSIENPCEDVPRFNEQKRERYLAAEELARLGPALVAEKAEHLHAVAAILILAFTGARPTEVLELKRELLRLELGHVMVKRKGRWLPIYLPPPAIAILEDTPAVVGNPYVFPSKVAPEARRAGRREPGHVTLTGEVHDVWNRVRKAAGLEDVRLYDLRHTLASVAVNTGYSLEVIGGLLGHTSVTTTARYAHLAAAPVRAAGEKVAAEIAGALRHGTP